MVKINCWEFKKCGRQPGGENVADFGLCAAATTEIMDGVHGGVKAGRACFAVVGTPCGELKTAENATHGTHNCISCSFYHMLKNEEGQEFITARDLLALY